MTSILVTGLGSLGIAVIRKFALEGFDVVSYDVASVSPMVSSTLKDVESRVKYVRGDVQDQYRLIGASKENKVEGIIHTAALTGRGSGIDYPTAYFSVNAGGVLNVLETARILGMGRVVFTSSVSLFGSREEPVKDTDMPGPENFTSFYNVAKYSGEMLMHAYHNIYGMDTVTCRLHNIYGIGEIKPKAIGTWLWTVLKGEKIVEPTGADVEDDNSYAGDLANGMYLLYTSKGLTDPRVYNLSDGRIRRHGDIVEIVNGIGPGKVVLGPGEGGRWYQPRWLKTGSPPFSDISRIRNLGFNPRPIEENLVDYAEWIRSEIKRLGPCAGSRITY